MCQKAYHSLMLKHLDLDIMIIKNQVNLKNLAYFEAVNLTWFFKTLFINTLTTLSKLANLQGVSLDGIMEELGLLKA